MPTIAPLSDGTWVAAQHVGESLGSSDNHIEFLVSRDQGATWENRGSVHGGEGPDERYTYRAPKIVAVPDGRLLISADRYPLSAGPLFDLGGGDPVAIGDAVDLVGRPRRDLGRPTDRARRPAAGEIQLERHRPGAAGEPKPVDLHP